jgi:hypothetical protein
MSSRFGALGLLASVSLVACSHSANEAPHTAASGRRSAAKSGSGWAPVASPASPSEAVADRAAPSPAARGGAAYEPAPSAEMAQAEKSRPGLGTSWGERVSSRVSGTSFTRASSDSPDATAAFFYNDESGVAASARGRFVDYGDSVMPLVGGSVTVSLVDTSGRPLRAAHVDGRTIAVGSDGDRYVVRVDNHTNVRIEAVATVDGLDVVDGGDGDLRKRGYVIAPYDSLEIEGFRESEGSVRAFRFGSVSDSYASRRGKDRNVGVVGVALFREEGSDFRWTQEELNRRETADPFPSRFAPAPGTGF